MDEQKGGQVAPRPKKQANKTKQAQVQTPPAFPCVFTEEVGYVHATEAGNSISRALGLLREAAETPAGRARWEAWEILRNEVEAARRGSVPLPLDLAAQPLLFVAARAVSAWIDSFAPVYLPEGQPTNANSGEVKL